MVDQGVKEVTLLGQNVNSYRDESVVESLPGVKAADQVMMSRGFKTVYKPKTLGRGFVDLLDRVSLVDPNLRIRFTSPHPKDFPDQLLYLMRDRSNICKQIHLPAQSGSSAVLDRMRRGYSREAYLELVENIRTIIPKVSLSSDFISGFCGETENDHQETLSLLEKVGYDMAYMFAYSMREKTMAHRRYVDDVTEETKQRRLREVIDKFYSLLSERVTLTIGNLELVLVEGSSKKSDLEFCGKSDGGRVIVFPKKPIFDTISGCERIPQVGDFVSVKLIGRQGATPIGEPISFI